MSNCYKNSVYYIIDSMVPCMQVLFYSTEIFAAAGIKYSEVATIVVGITLLVFTVVTVSELD